VDKDFSLPGTGIPVIHVVSGFAQAVLAVTITMAPTEQEKNAAGASMEDCTETKYVVTN
jgi:hypothetical protein